VLQCRPFANLQKGTIALQSLLKLLWIVGSLEELLDALKPETTHFSSIDEVTRANKKVCVKEATGNNYCSPVYPR